MVITTTEALLRIGASVVCGAAIGYEREHAGRPAGLRTQLLVCLASATFMLVSTQFLFYQPYGKDDLVMVDTSRIAASVVSGVGFLGAGAIMRIGVGVQGLTTAASLWMTASIGLAAGGGMYLVAAVSTSVALVCLVWLRRFEAKRGPQLQRRVTVVMDDAPEHTAAVTSLLGRYGAAHPDIEFDHNLRTHKSRLTADVRFDDADAFDRLLAELATSPGVRKVKLHRVG